MKLPSAFNARVPWLGPVTSTAVRLSPSMSVSLNSTPEAGIVRGVSSFAVKASSLATGASFTGLTVIVTVATADVAVPSVMR